MIAAALAFARPPSTLLMSAKRASEPIDLGSTDEDEPAEPAPKRAASGTSSSSGLSLPSGAAALRGVPVPSGWSVQGGSLLVRAFGEPTPSATIAAFDFDGCVANTPLGGNDPNAWSMQFAHVPAVLKALHAAGHSIVLVTNESMDRFKKPDAIRSAILKKTGRLAGFAAAANVPMLALCATAKDDFRKPATGAWTFLRDHANAGVPIDRAASFFVGDAAGRPGDHSDSDRAFALKVGVTFHDEKTFFNRLHPPA